MEVESDEDFHLQLETWSNSSLEIIEPTDSQHGERIQPDISEDEIYSNESSDNDNSEDDIEKKAKLNRKSLLYVSNQ